MWVRFVELAGAGPGIEIKFLDPPQYSIGYCKNYTEFSESKTGWNKKKVWTFKKENNTLQLFCGNEEIFNFNFMDCNENTCSDECKQKWSSKDSIWIKFNGNDDDLEDTASDYYRSLPKSNCYRLIKK